MKQLINIADSAARRMQLQETIVSSTTVLFWIACIFAVTGVIDRSFSEAFVAWEPIAIVLIVCWLVAIILFWRRSHHNRLQSAAEVDNRLGLHDRLGSAIACSDRDDAFATVVIDDAVTVVEQENIKKRLRKYFPIVLPKLWMWIGVLGVVFTAIFMSPQWNFFSSGQDNPNAPLAVADRKDIEASVKAVVEDLREDEALRDALAEELASLDAASELDVDPSELRREALRKMTDLQRKLDNLLNDENALAYQETLRRLQSLELPRDEETTQLAAALKSGDFSQAKKEIDKLEGKLQSEELSAEERKQLQEQLKKLGEQLSGLANANDALSDALAASGMDPNLASDALAAENAIKSNDKLTEAQKKKLLEMLEAQKQAMKMCKKMGGACKKCAGGKPADFAAMANAAKQLEAMKLFMTKAEAAKSQCQKAGGGMCKKPGSGMGSTGGQGKGSGGRNDITETETAQVANRSPVHTVEGSIIARQLFEGGLVAAGDSKATVRETVLSQQRSAQEAIAQEEVPRQYHNLLRHYFGHLEKLANSSDNEDAVSDE
ncbi:MAG: hypothetical protein QF444_00640 [Phycisphaerales bacterium]|nr:hypothetical protein [Phycisphaerales bacterium]